MPTGISVRYIHCKRCPKMKFKTVSELRTHQWRVHPELYENLHQTTTAAAIDAEKERNRARTAKARAIQAQMRAATTDVTVRQYLDTPAPANGEMRVSELLSELEAQGNFIQKVIALVGGIQSRQSERISK